MVGSLLDGRWYGGHYGWSWPHGWYSVGCAAAVAVLAAAAVTGDDSYLDLLRPALDTMIENGKVMAFADGESSLPAKWYPQLGEAVTIPTMLVPFRHSDRGSFDYNTMLAAIPMALWHHSNDPADRQRLEELRKAAGYDWRTVRSFRSKEEAGHEEPWFTYLAGDNPDYPEMILSAAQASCFSRSCRVQVDCFAVTSASALSTVLACSSRDGGRPALGLPSSRPPQAAAVLPAGPRAFDTAGATRASSPPIVASHRAASASQSI